MSVTYPVHITCPTCGRIAANVTVTLVELLERVRNRHEGIDRHILRSDRGKPGPSHHVVVCQHCHYPFRASVSRIVDKPRTL